MIKAKRSEIHRDKRGTHIGVMISFIIFITFLAFLYFILAPALRVQRERGFLLNDIEGLLLEQLTETALAVPINFTNASLNNNHCIKLSGIPNIFKDAGIDQKKLRIDDESGKPLQYKDLGASGIIIDLDPSLAGMEFSGTLIIYRLNYLSPYLNDSLTSGCPNFNDKSSELRIGDLREIEITYNVTVLNLFTEYSTDYEALKSKLGIPKENDFSLQFLDESKNLIDEIGDQNPHADVYIEEILIQYADEYGNLRFGFIIIKIW